MYLISTETIRPHLSNPYYYRFLPEFVLLGFAPASEDVSFVATKTDHDIYVVPVFLGYKPGWQFDIEGDGSGDWILFFHGCDDASYGSRFVSEYEALEWLHRHKALDFKDMVWDTNYKLSYWN